MTLINLKSLKDTISGYIGIMWAVGIFTMKTGKISLNIQEFNKP